MNILLISSDRTLADTLGRAVIRDEDRLVVRPDMETAASQYADGSVDVVILSDRAADVDDWRDAMASLGRESDRAQKIVLLGDRHDAAGNAAALKHALSEGWEAVLPGLTARQAADQIARLVYGASEAGDRRKRSGIIHFVGTTPNIGVTIAAYGTAVQMAGMTERKIAYVCLNLKSSKIHRYVGEQAGGALLSLDGLRAELRSGSLTPERLLRQSRVAERLPNLHIVYGNMQREQADYYTVEEIECLLGAAGDAFDYCVVETGAYWDNAATIGVMLQAGQRIMVTTPLLTHFQEDMNRWFGALSPMFGLQRTDFDLLVTQLESGSLYRARDVARESGMPRIGEIRKLPEAERYLSEGRLTEAALTASPLNADLSRLARALLALRGEAYRREGKARSGLSWMRQLTLRMAGGRVDLAGK